MKKGDKVVCVNVDLTSDAGDTHTVLFNMGTHFEDETGEWHKKIDYMKFHGEAFSGYSGSIHISKRG